MKTTKRQHALEPIKLDAYKPLREVVSETLRQAMPGLVFVFLELSAAEAEKRDNCERAKRNLAALENNQPMVTLDENGQRKVMDTTQREQEMERARRFMAESCK